VGAAFACFWPDVTATARTEESAASRWEDVRHRFTAAFVPSKAATYHRASEPDKRSMFLNAVKKFDQDLGEKKVNPKYNREIVHNLIQTELSVTPDADPLIRTVQFLNALEKLLKRTGPNVYAAAGALIPGAQAHPLLQWYLRGQTTMNWDSLTPDARAETAQRAFIAFAHDGAALRESWGTSAHIQRLMHEASIWALVVSRDTRQTMISMTLGLGLPRESRREQREQLKRERSKMWTPMADAIKLIDTVPVSELELVVASHYTATGITLAAYAKFMEEHGKNPE
jgi:hypothetical protein